MANLRQKRRVDYQELANGAPLPKVHVSNKTTWSTRKLYELEIKDNRQVNGELEVYVHYIGWPTKYDEWRSASEVLDIPEEFLTSTEESRKLFFANFRTSIKESLHGIRKADSLVELRLPIAKDIFAEVAELGSKDKKGAIRFEFANLVAVLGDNFHYRIFNRHGDFAYIRDDTLSCRLCEREPLKEYTQNGEPLYTHRGFVLVVKFQRLLGNKEDFQTFLTC